MILWLYDWSRAVGRGSLWWTDLVTVHRLWNMTLSVSVSLSRAGSGWVTCCDIRLRSGFGSCWVFFWVKRFCHGQACHSNYLVLFVFLSTLLESFMFVPVVLTAWCINALGVEGVQQIFWHLQGLQTNSRSGYQHFLGCVVGKEVTSIACMWGLLLWKLFVTTDLSPRLLSPQRNLARGEKNMSNTRKLVLVVLVSWRNFSIPVDVAEFCSFIE